MSKQSDEIKAHVTSFSPAEELIESIDNTKSDLIKNYWQSPSLGKKKKSD